MCTLCPQKNVSSLACYYFDMDFDIFGRNVTDKVGNQNMLYCATSNNLCFLYYLAKMRKHKNHIFFTQILYYTRALQQLHCVACTMHQCGVSSWKKKLSSVMCLIPPNVC